MQVGAWLTSLSKGATVEEIGKGEEFFATPSPIGVPRPLPVLWRYWDYIQFGESQLPDIDTPGSGRVWREFRMVHRMYSKWRGLRDGDEEVTLEPGKSYEDRYIPKVKPRNAGNSGGKAGGVSSKRVPKSHEVP